jgi:acetate kinase
MTRGLVLVANPGSASRKYALFDASGERARLHFEWVDGRIIGTLYRGDKTHSLSTHVTDLAQTTDGIMAILQGNDVVAQSESLNAIGIRVVAPGGYFLDDHVADDGFIQKLEEAKQLAPLHIAATMAEITTLRRSFPDIPIVGISDSGFHRTKPDHAWNYGIDLDFSDTHDIKRFGYHGLSVASVLKQTALPDKVIVCHLGSGASITATLRGKSVDTTMGYSPLEGLIMGTRSGSIDLTAAAALQSIKGFDNPKLESYLNNQSGLLGLGGSSDIRELLAREDQGTHRAHLTLDTYCYVAAKAIGSMAAALNGAGAIIFTGAVGERSAPIRKRIVDHLGYLGFAIDQTVNTSIDTTLDLVSTKQSKPVLVVPTKEEWEIVDHVNKIT